MIKNYIQIDRTADFRLTKKIPDNPVQPFSFNPNIVTRDELRNMNLPESFISGFINYRNAGAKFSDWSDMDRLFVMTKETWLWESLD